MAGSLGIFFMNAQSLRYNLAQPYTGLTAYSTQHTDALSFTGNQAALTQTNHAGIGLFAERRFLLKETSRYQMAAAFPTHLGNIGIQLNYAGFKNFHENSIGLAYAKSLGKSIDVGVQFNYYGYRVASYGSASTINVEMGVLIHLNENLHAGIHIYNPVGGKLGKSSAPGAKAEKLAAVYKLGFGYDASKRFFIAAEVVKEEDKPVNVVAGLQYQFADQFFIRAGMLSESASVYAGAGISWKNLRLDISATYHPQLGFSPGLLLLMHFKKKAG